MRKITEEEIGAVLKLDAVARFSHFVKRVVDDQKGWGLWKDGWALMTDAADQQVFPLWPAREYADKCRADDWLGYEPTEIDVHDLVEELLPKLKAQNVRAGVFPTPIGKGVILTADELSEALRKEMQRYE